METVGTRELKQNPNAVIRRVLQSLPYADRDLDAKVERTRSRPIPAGQVSVTQAVVFMVAQALIGHGLAQIRHQRGLEGVLGHRLRPPRR